MMTNQEARETLVNLEAAYRDLDPLVLTDDSIQIVNKRIEAIGMAISALEKQIPLQHLPYEMGADGAVLYPCGNCGEDVKGSDYCPWCGQRVGMIGETEDEG